MIDRLKIDENIYFFIDKMSLEKENFKDIVDYVHYKALLELFTYIIENNKGFNVDFLLPDYIEVINNIENITKKINKDYEK